MTPTEPSAGVPALISLVIVARILFPISTRTLLLTILPALLFTVPLVVVGSLSTTLRGVAGVVTAVAAAGGLPPGELQQGISGLPLPRILRMVLVQTVHQAGVLRRETSAMIQALRVRRRRNGLVMSWRLAAALPEVWLGRMFARADRVAICMSLRGFTPEQFRFRVARWSLRDQGKVILTCGIFAAAIVGRWLA